MPGFSITLLLLTDNVDLILSLLDDPTNAPGWKWSSKTEPRAVAATASLASVNVTPPSSQSALRAPDARSFESAIERACKALLAAEGEITDMDKIAGDGDCGLTLSAGASGQSPYPSRISWLLMVAYPKASSKFSTRVPSQEET